MLETIRCDRLDFDRKTSGRCHIKSLGGCLTASVMQTFSHHSGVGHRHFWRRPTIALMAEPFGPSPELPDYLPPFLLKYIGHDMAKIHLDRLFEGPCDVLVFDVTRDVLQGVMDFGGDRIITDPLSLKGWSYDGERPTRDDLTAIFGPDHKIRTYEDPEFFGLYEHFFDVFVRRAAAFERLIINRIYYTDRIASRTDTTFGDPHLVRRINLFLDRVYNHIERYYPHITVNHVDARFLMAAETAPYGLFHTHYIAETIALFADGVANLALGRRYPPGRLFQDFALASALERTDRDRDGRTHLAAVEAARDDKAGEADALRRDLDAARAEADRLRSECDLHAGEAARHASDLDAARVALAEVRLQLDTRTAEAEALARGSDALEEDASPEMHHEVADPLV